VQNVTSLIATTMDFVLLIPKKLRKLVNVSHPAVKRQHFVKNITKIGKKKLKMLDL